MARDSDDQPDFPRYRESPPPAAWKLPAAAEAMRAARALNDSPDVLALARMVLEVCDGNH